jgi:RNA polymerase-interacting CarD/CdnL/TRCF family regulator
MKLQSINDMKILVAVMQLLSENVRTIRQTDMVNLQYATFETYHTESDTNYRSSYESPCRTGSLNDIYVITALHQQSTT